MEKKRKRSTIKYLEEQFNKYMLVNLLVSILIIILGLILFINPSIAIKTVSWLIGLVFLLVGSLSIYSYMKKDRINLFTFNLIYGVISIVVGLLVILNPFAIANILTISLGIWLIISGGLKVNYGVRLKNIKEQSWALTLFVGVISMLFGLMVILNPFSKLVIVEVIGLFLIVYGIIDLTDIILLKKRAKNFIKLYK